MSESMELNRGQRIAVQSVTEHLAGGDGVFYLAGWAGTGKTTTVSRALFGRGSEIAVCSPTGKAAHVLRGKGLKAQTLHSLIYKPEGQVWSCKSGCGTQWSSVEEEAEVRSKDCVENKHDVKASKMYWARKRTLEGVRGIVVDESSMVNQEIGEDLLSFGLPIVALGDPFQLPPVEGKGWLTKGREPDAMLTELMRFENGELSGVVDMATRVREGRTLPRAGERGADWARIQRVPWAHKKFLDDSRDQMIIVATHAKRFSINSQIRKAKWGHNVGALPVAGDRLICKVNDQRKGLFNGMPVVATRNAEPYTEDLQRGVVEVHFKTEAGVEHSLTCWEHWFTEPKAHVEIAAIGPKARQHFQISYGYAITGHSAQGSEWDSVTVDATPQTWMGKDWPKWLYTSITRARNVVNIVG